MILKNERELANTRNKLQMLQEEYRAAQMAHDDEDSRVRKLSMQSLKRLISQLQEEISRYEACQVAR